MLLYLIHPVGVVRANDQNNSTIKRRNNRHATKLTSTLLVRARRGKENVLSV